MTPCVLNAKNIKKVYTSPTPLEVLKDISLQVEQGMSVAIMGKSGCGKSTLLNILGTLESATSGSIEICGSIPTSLELAKVRSRHIGFIFQSYHLLDDYSLLDNVLMPARIAREDVSKHSLAYERALFLLEQVGLQDKRSLLSKHLSGGEKQRSCIARALCNDPTILFADEPTGNLDPKTAAAIESLLFDCVKKYQKTLLLVTHDPDLASLCHKTFHLKDGLLHPMV